MAGLRLRMGSWPIGGSEALRLGLAGGMGSEEPDLSTFWKYFWAWLLICKGAPEVMSSPNHAGVNASNDNHKSDL